MAITLPSGPVPLVTAVNDLDFGVRQTPPGGGLTRQYDRLGSRHSLTFSMPAMDAACARQWIGARAKSRQSGTPVRMAFRQPDFTSLPAIGSALVNGGSQAGNTLTIDGCTHGALIEAGRALSLVVSGRSYLYFVTDDVTVNGSGQAVVPIDGLLMRASPADNAAVAFDAPVIEGFIKGADWQTAGKRFATFADFTIDECA